MSTTYDCIIIGAGLSGLTTAVRLHRHGIASFVLEARERLGGRILTERTSGGAYDLGPAWFWEHQPNIQRVMQELNVASFVQFENGLGVYDQGAGQKPHLFRSPPMPVSYRFVNGVSSLIEGFANQLPPDSVSLHTVAEKIVENEDRIAVRCNRGTFYGRHVVCTLPPKLVVDSLVFEPPLSAELHTTMENTMTWMGQAMKVTLAYETAFWRERGLSGLTMSHSGRSRSFTIMFRPILSTPLSSAGSPTTAPPVNKPPKPVAPP